MRRLHCLGLKLQETTAPYSSPARTRLDSGLVAELSGDGKFLARPDRRKSDEILFRFHFFYRDLVLREKLCETACVPLPLTHRILDLTNRTISIAVERNIVVFTDSECHVPSI
jgi:hypothetical protein